MSRTMSPGLVDASHWTYVAAAMSAGLRKAADQSLTSPDLFPRAVLQAARDFFKTVSEAFGTGVPINAVATAANYSIAAKALRNTVIEASTSRSSLNTLLGRYAEMVDKLNQEKQLAENDVKDVKDLSMFFRRIAENGEIEAYERYSQRV